MCMDQYPRPHGFGLVVVLVVGMQSAGGGGGDGWKPSG